MAGLLYKDFVAVKGRVQLFLLIVLTLILIVISFYGYDDMTDILLASQVASVPFFLLIFVLYSWEIKILSVDEGKKNIEYLFSLPISKEQYIASKYWLMLIAYYVVLSVAEFWATIYMIRGYAYSARGMVKNMAELMPVAVCIFLMITSIELPFFIVLGSRRGKQVKNFIAVIIFFLLIVFLLFGDLTLLDTINFDRIFAYFEKHEEIMTSIKVFIPVVSAIFYYLSYRITCSIYWKEEKGERIIN